MARSAISCGPARDCSVAIWTPGASAASSSARSSSAVSTSPARRGRPCMRPCLAARAIATRVLPRSCRERSVRSLPSELLEQPLDGGVDRVPQMTLIAILEYSPRHQERQIIFGRVDEAALRPDPLEY